MPSSKRISRRKFHRASAASAFAFTFVPRTAWGANDRIHVGSIGIGGKGASDVRDVAKAGGTIVALCDVDDRRRHKGNDVTKEFPDAKLYRDFREMLDKEGKRLDAVTVSTPDHTHCIASVTAMRMGKHVYCQKPLTRTIGEARLMSETAAKHGVATQMGNQVHAGEPIRRAVEYIRGGVIGKVKEVHTWTNRPIWPQGMTARPAAEPVPPGLDWDLWLGPAPERPYAKGYVPFSWRGWWDFGTGALGDMGCHIMDMPYWALDLKYPIRVEAEQEGNTAESGPNASTVTYHFAPGAYSGDLAFNWYDGNRMNRRPVAELFDGFGLADSPEAAAKVAAKRYESMLVGEKGRLLFGRRTTEWLTAPGSLLEDFTPPAPTIPRVKSEDHEWLDAIRGGAAALSNFALSGPFTEVVLLGNLAVRLGRPIEWDGPKMQAVGAPEADALIHATYRKGWEL